MTTQMPEILDSEILAIERVLTVMRDKAILPRNYEAFSKEMKERFEAIGFTVSISWWHSDVEDVKMPEVTITGRTGTHVFDPDEQVSQAVANVLDLPGESGWISSKSSDALRRMKEQQEGHGAHKHCS